ncbi:uncharacterized protein VP01_210g16 [Puccinia sorghi]|uniref:Pescadillo homolog n=1 Tax=Puccinia sorghi TaxID=27349 RepID=A0A0L6VAQ1_9BASI|nr:uncharacterized protein VP01_210g16 [Puccinia sorghi]
MGRTAPAHIKTVRPGLKKKKGTTGAARNYVTRNQALKKLQCTLSDFRRLCILKGIYPREPKSRKKANRGSTAAASFYYSKDIAYLLHEPVLQKLREHKAFAKKLSRALGRKEDGLAKNLDSAHEVFTDAIRDLDDALSLIILFANLPSTNHVSPTVIANCARLAAEWQTYVMKSRSLKHVFLSIKGIYYQAEVEGQRVTWLVPYAFTQTIPADVDFRIMLTFLELYQTLLGFVFYRLFQTINLVYPPKLDFEMDEAGAGLNALILESNQQALVADQADSKEERVGRQTAKQVREQIKSLISAQPADVPDEEGRDNQQNDQMEMDPGVVETHDQVEEEGLFKPYAFFLSREVTRPMLEFVIKCSGGEVGWDPILGAGSPYLETDSRITHHVIDRPQLPPSTAGLPQRAFIQPQWVVDCINKLTLLPTEEYGPGKTLPPHLSPFVDDEEVRRQGGYLPQASLSSGVQGPVEIAEDEDQEEEEEESGEKEVVEEPAVAEQAQRLAARPALMAVASNAGDSDLLHAAEIEAEELGISHEQFQQDLKRAVKEKSKSNKKTSQGNGSLQEDDNAKMAEMLLSAKQRKLYTKMSYSKHQRAQEKRKLETKKKNLMNHKKDK